MTQKEKKERQSIMNFNKHDFSRIIINDVLSYKGGRAFLKKYKQSEVREIVEGYRSEANQDKLVEISRLLYAKSPQYKRLVNYFSGMALFSHILSPIKDIQKVRSDLVLKQYSDIGELTRMMNLRHEMTKVLKVAFREDVFYGYIFKEEKSFYIQPISPSICKITSIDEVYNFSIDMTYFTIREKELKAYASEISDKYFQWKTKKKLNSQVSDWVELDSKNTICIKINEETSNVFPPFAGSFDSIYDVEGFKQLRKDKEELANYMVITQHLPIREDSEDNNDFLIDEDMMTYFHSQAVDAVPENVGVITSPMKVEALKFERDKADSDGVLRAERDLWSGLGVSQLLFNADKTTSEGLKASIKTDEQIVFNVLNQIQRWLNRYLKYQFNDLFFNVSILPVTYFNRQEMFDMYIMAGQYGVPVKSAISAVVGLDPIEVMNMAYLENDLLKMHDEFIPLQSSHTMSGDDPNSESGRPKKDPSEESDETARGRDKANA